MKILKFGQKGQVARELARRRPVGVSTLFLCSDQVDLMRPAAALANCDVVINAAAWAAVDEAEAKHATVTVVNSAAHATMVVRCAALGLPFLRVSTDYAFDGSGESPCHRDHPTDTLGTYRRSKLVGEQGGLILIPTYHRCALRERS